MMTTVSTTSLLSLSHRIVLIMKQITELTLRYDTLLQHVTLHNGISYCKEYVSPLERLGALINSQAGYPIQSEIDRQTKASVDSLSLTVTLIRINCT